MAMTRWVAMPFSASHLYPLLPIPEWWVLITGLVGCRGHGQVVLAILLALLLGISLAGARTAAPSYQEQIKAS